MRLTPSSNHTNTPTRQQENAERAGAKLVERRKQLTALQTNLARDRQDLEGFEREMVRGCWLLAARLFLVYIVFLTD